MATKANFKILDAAKLFTAIAAGSVAGLGLCYVLDLDAALPAVVGATSGAVAVWLVGGKTGRGYPE